MFKTIDLYLGMFLILCGFVLSLLNIRSIVFSKNRYSSILLSENILLSCIGLAFLCRAIYSLNPTNVDMEDIQLKLAGVNFGVNHETHCGFSSLLLSYGPLVLSLVNSFLSLIVDNYMHYKMLKDIKIKDDQNIVQQIGESSRSVRQEKISRTYNFFKKYFSYFTIALQWIVPILMALFMYPMNVKEMLTNELRSSDNTCMAMLDLSKYNCSYDNITKWETFTDFTELRKYTPAQNYLDIIETEEPNKNVSNNIGTILSNVINIVRNYNNQTDFNYTNISKSLRRPKFDNQCMKICFTDNQNMLIYMLILAFISYFVPITISTVILTKIHIMQVNRPNAKTYVTRELLYNILFWTPVMFDTFLSLILCSFSMQSMKTSLFNVVANVYQAVKNFMNTRYFKENEVMPA